jgi:hypothetical protein
MSRRESAAEEDGTNGFGDALERDDVDAGQQQLHQSDRLEQTQLVVPQFAVHAPGQHGVRRRYCPATLILPTSARYVMSTSLPSTSANAFRVSAERKNVTTT